jgi:RND superfamily putative drug exporter
MHLLGDAAWWLPKWLERILPNVDVEGASLERTHPVPVPAASASEAEGQSQTEAPRVSTPHG